VSDRCRLYVVTPPAIDLTIFPDLLASALDAGDVACLQIRLKDIDDDAVRRAAAAIVPVAQQRGVAVLMNDRPDLAVETGCDGAHVGQTDAHARDARRILGDLTLGVTCHASLDLAFAAGEAGADYVAFGAFFPTSTKEASTRAEPELLTWWSDIATIPCVAIGGITAANCAPLVPISSPSSGPSGRTRTVPPPACASSTTPSTPPDPTANSGHNHPLAISVRGEWVISEPDA
jgi:thiamine-phosphate pyrophosphorylase